MSTFVIRYPEKPKGPETSEEYLKRLGIRTDQPIICGYGADTMVLIQQMHVGKTASSYDYAGWNWLRLKDFRYNSCTTWTDPAKAIRCYESRRPRNGSVQCNGHNFYFVAQSDGEERL